MFTAEEIENALKTSPIGLSTIRYIESEGMLVEMNYDTNAPDWLCGSISGRNVLINVCNHSNANEVAETIVHEIAHRRFSWNKTQEDEVNCRIYEYLHTHETISDAKISEIVSFVKSEYDNFIEGDLYGY